jgi:hypothetical protein
MMNAIVEIKLNNMFMLTVLVTLYGVAHCLGL